MGLQVHKIVLLISAIILLYACNTPLRRLDSAEAIAQKSGMHKQVINTGKFVLTTYSRIDSKDNDLLIVYIEGDGHAFKRKYTLSSDPTPIMPVALELAAEDPNSSILYIARPCQYLSSDQLKTCDPKYWSTHRYSDEVITSIDKVISRFSTDYHEIALVGYSGGGTVATLVAARHKNIKWLVTVAANLDQKAWTEFHKVSPLSGSLNAVNVASILENTRQIHYIGGKDTIVPEKIVRSYMKNYGENSNVKMIVKPGFDHHCCWVKDWTVLMCKNGDEFSLYCK